MNKYKICVYAICKNEEKFVDKWYESMKEADEIFVLDTGSDDNTIEKLKSHNIHVIKKEINPWRFDVARNLSIEMIPEDYDICVCTDLDEVFNKGWRKKIEDNWNKYTTRLYYTYNWKLDENNKPMVSFLYDKIHARHGYKWINPVHEVLSYNNQEFYLKVDSIILNHYPDQTKSRSSYLPLLELSVKENPENDRNMHYLGREYMYYGRWNDSIDTLIKHLKLKSATWKDERCASMRFISRCYKNLNRFDEAILWINKAIIEAPYLRDPYVEAALLYYELNNLKKSKKYCLKALKIKENSKSYINEVFSWNHTIYDLLTICYFEEGNYKLALKNINKAIKLCNINEDKKRLLNNKKIIKNYLI